ncbi:MAG: hypothetical protein GKS05_00095 [Nitrospirales bacterium]|nr:hypothetical protein [Nitrospirales bacterium]
MFHRVILCLFLFSLLGTEISNGQSTQEAIERIGNGRINWTTGQITATGVGVVSPGQRAMLAQAMAERAAFAIALRNLLEVIKGIRVDSETVVENYMIKNDAIRTQVEGMVKGAQQLAKRTAPDGSVEIDVRFPITGALSNTIIPQEFGYKHPTSDLPFDQSHPKLNSHMAPSSSLTVPDPFIPIESPFPKEEVRMSQTDGSQEAQDDPLSESIPLQSTNPEMFESRTHKEFALPDQPFQRSYTGLIVDARGIGLRPALIPRLLSEHSQEFYVGGVVSRDRAVESGVVGYSKDLVAASRQHRISDQPLIVKGQRTAGAKKTDIVLGQKDIARIQLADSSTHFLEQARVVVVYD